MMDAVRGGGEKKEKKSFVLTLEAEALLWAIFIQQQQQQAQRAAL